MEAKKHTDSQNTPEQKEYALGIIMSDKLLQSHRVGEAVQGWGVGDTHHRAGEMAGWKKCLPCKYEDMSPSAQHPCKKLGVALHAATAEAETGRSLSLVDQLVWLNP